MTRAAPRRTTQGSTGSASASGPPPSTVIWQRPLVVGKGGVPITSEQIAEAAFAAADHENLHAVSLKRVAARLGVPAPRLSAYITSRDDLFDLMLDVAYGKLEYPDPVAGGHWRDDLAAVARSTKEVASRHPWMMSLIGSRPPSGPNGLRITELSLRTVDGLGLDVAGMTQVVTTVLAYAYGFVQIELLQPSHRSVVRPDTEHRVATAQYLVRTVADGDHPVLARLFEDPPDAGDTFEAGLACVLDGVAHRLGAAERNQTDAVTDAVTTP